MNPDAVVSFSVSGNAQHTHTHTHANRSLVGGYTRFSHEGNLAKGQKNRARSDDKAASNPDSHARQHRLGNRAILLYSLRFHVP